jgi:Lar family restriction alleviation protein
MSSKEELKPCPFCGGEAETAYAINDYNRWGAYCKGCGASVEAADWKGAPDTEKAAIAAWNRRYKEDANAQTN